MLFIFVEIGQLIGKLVRFLVRQLNRVAPPRVSAVVVVVLLLALSIALLNGVVVRFGMGSLNKTFAAVNDETDPDFPAPMSPLRSGGPESLASWESLGHQGRVFVSAGPTVEELTKFNGKPAIEPIRAYAGLHSADGIKATAALAAEELRRTGGLNRDVVAVATTTGTGWINEAEASALEYMYNGNTAIVSMQYSFLPSWLSFLVDKENARQAGQALFEAVDAMIREMPEAQRPKLVVFGESLGSFGGEAPFLSLNNLTARTDGALLLRAHVQQHDLGRPHPQPRQGLAGVAADLRQGRERPLRRAAGQPRPPGRPVGRAASGLPPARVGPDRLVEPRSAVPEPDWLREPRGYDLSARMEWIPVVTFLQVSADMAVAVDVPDGHGHVYVKDVANALGGGAAAAGVDAGEDRAPAPAVDQRRERLTTFAPRVRGDQNAFGLQRVIAADDVGRPMQPEVDQRRRGQAGGVALRAQHHPFHVVVDGLRKLGVAGRVAAPLQHIAFDHQRGRHVSLAVALGLRTDVDQYRAAPQRAGHVPGGQSP